MGIKPQSIDKSFLPSISNGPKRRTLVRRNVILADHMGFDEKRMAIGDNTTDVTLAYGFGYIVSVLLDQNSTTINSRMRENPMLFDFDVAPQY